MTDHAPPHDFPADTSREALRRQLAAVRRMSVPERLRMVDHLTQLARSIAVEGIRRRHPNATEEQIQHMLFELVLGKEVAARVAEHRRARSAQP